MNIIKGDLVSLAEEGFFDVIVHGCNCFNTMGAGIAKTIKQKFPEAYEADLATEKGSREKLGTYSMVRVNLGEHSLIVVNAYTQFDWKSNAATSDQGFNADYDAIRSVFQKIKANFSGQKIGYPRIGAGLAEGDWSVISQIIAEELTGKDHTLVEYQLK